MNQDKELYLGDGNIDNSMYVLEDPFQSEFGFAKWNIQKNIVIANKLLVKRFWFFSVALRKTCNEIHENKHADGIRYLKCK